MKMDEYEKYRLIEDHAQATAEYAHRAIAERHGDQDDFADRIKVRCARMIEPTNEIIGIS